MSKIFISHAVRDGAAKASELVASLETSGNECWIAPRDIVPGRTYPAQIMAAIREGRGLVVLLTEAAIQSPDVLQEVQIAHSSQRLIVPVAVGEARLSDDLGYFLSVRQHLNWSSAEAVAAAVAKVLPPPAIDSLRGSDHDRPIEPAAAVAAAAAADGGIEGKFRLKVLSTGQDAGTLWLCSEVDYRDPRCLSVAIRGEARQALLERHGTQFGSFFRDRTIMIEGIARKKRVDFVSGGKPTGHYYFQTHVEVESLTRIGFLD
jgi:hypothetical protein